MASGNNFMNTSSHPSTTTDTAGPHNSNIANKLDPRVDSDRDGRAGGLGSTNTTHTGGFGSQHQPGATSTYGTGTTTAGPHSSNLANKLDPRVDSDRDGHATHGTTGGVLGSNTHGTTGGVFGSNTHGSTNAGPHNTNTANKLDPRIDSDRDGRATHGVSSNTTAGPHKSDLANKLDPRVDSDRDGRAHHNTGALGPNTSTNAGPHNSNVANKLDPRFDSDRDGKATDSIMGANKAPHTSHTTHGSTTAGPHSSNLANKLDPRVDSDRDGHHAGTHGTTTTHSATTGGALSNTTHGTHGTHGTHNTSTNAGPHNSNIANKLDPKVDSDRDGSAYRGTGTLGKIPMVDNHGHSTASHARTTPTSKANLPGPAPNTAGPHKSDLLNKLDPRVDSNLDGSKTIGGNKTGSI